MNDNCNYDIIGFANDLGLSLQEVSELYAELITEINLALSGLQILISKKDIIKIQKIIHNIKGVSGNYRITDIYAKTTEINDSLKSNEYNNFESALNDLFNISYHALKEIKDFFKQNSIQM